MRVGDDFSAGEKERGEATLEERGEGCGCVCRGGTTLAGERGGAMRNTERGA